jgi:Tfp pilus assembly protein FimT
MKPRTPMNRGLTFLELTISVGILAILLVIVVPSFMDFRRNSILSTETQNVITLVNKARLSSMSSKEDTQYGIHFESSKVVLFQGDTYTAGAGTNEELILNTALTLSSVVVNGGGAEVVFQKVTGATNQNATTTLLVTGGTASTTILVLPSGVVTRNQ